MNTDTSTAFQLGRILGMLVMGLFSIGGVVFFIVALVKAFTRKTTGWIIAAIAMALVGLLVVGALAFDFVRGAARYVAEQNTLTQVLTTKDGRHQMTVPASWKPLSRLNEQATIGTGNGVREQYAIVIIEPKASVGVDLAGYMKATSEQMASILQSSAQGELSELKISDYHALRRRITGRTEGLNLVYLHTCVEMDQDFAQILCWTLSGRESTALPIFEKVAATFREKNNAGK